MNKTLPAIEKELKAFKIKNNLVKKVNVSKEERIECEKLKETNQPLPDGIFYRSPAYTQDVELFYRVEKSDMTEDEIIEFLLIKQTEYLKSIKHMVAFLIAVALIVILIFLLGS